HRGALSAHRVERPRRVFVVSSHDARTTRAKMGDVSLDDQDVRGPGAPAPTGAVPPAQRAGTRLDPWFGAYAQRTHGMRASEIRALFAVATRPEVVSLAGGMPYLEGLPLEVIGDAIQRLVATRGTTALQYGSGQGDEGLREQIVEVMRLEA